MNIKRNGIIFLIIFVFTLLMSKEVVLASDTPRTLDGTSATIEGTNYEIDVETHTIFLNTGAEVELTGDAEDYKIVAVEDAKDVVITLNNYTAMTIDDGFNNSNKIELKPGSVVTLNLVGENNLRGGRESSAIRVPKDTSLTINGNGILNAQVRNSGSNASSAVIGSQYSTPFGDIIINVGKINTSFTGSGVHTGIGAGDYDRGEEMSGTITLNGGEIHTDLLGSSSDQGKVSVEGNGGAIVYTDQVLAKDDNFNGVIFSEDGSIGTVKGDVTLSSDLNIPDGTDLTIEEDAHLIIPEDVTLSNHGNIVNNGTITNTGTLQNDGHIESEGTINSSTPVEHVDGNPVKPILYEVTISVGDGGTINTDLTFQVNHGDDKDIIITPMKGYQIKEVIIDGVNRKDLVVNGKLTLTHITKDIEVIITFEKIPESIQNPDTYDGVIFNFYLGLISIIGIVLGSIYYKKEVL